MSQENKEFYDLLNELVNEQTFDLELTNGSFVKCKSLSTAQLKELVKAVVDSPITQSQFNSTATKIFKQSVQDSTEYVPNVVDRLLFLIETRIRSLSSTSTVTFNDKDIIINFEEVKKKLLDSIKTNKSLFESKVVILDKLGVSFSIPSIAVEAQLNEELHKDVNINVDDIDQLRRVLGEAFINEIAKTVNSVSIEDKTLDFSGVTFKSRLKTIESLPASLIQSVIEYIEKYKKVVDEALTVEGYTIPIDGSLFTVR